MKKVSLLALIFMPLGMAGNVIAQDAAAPDPHAAPNWQVTYNVGAQSDYVFRGISQTDGHSSGFAGADVTYRNQWYFGACRSCSCGSTHG